MKLNLQSSRPNAIFSSLSRRVTSLRVPIVISTLLITVIGIVIAIKNKIKKENDSTKARYEKEFLAEKALIKEEKELKVKNEKESSEYFCNYIKELRARDEQSHAKEKLIKGCTKLIKQKAFRRMPFKEAEKEIIKKALNLDPAIKPKAEGIPICKYRNFGNEEHPLQIEFDNLPENVKKELFKENSLFLSGNIDQEAQIEILKNADSFRYLAEKDKQILELGNEEHKPRFTASWECLSEPVLDNLHGVFYKPGKSPHIETTAAMLRYHLKKFNIDNIILPRREFWITRDPKIISDGKDKFKPLDNSSQIAPLMLEEYTENLVADLKKGREMYENLPPVVFNDMVISIAKIFSILEIGDASSKYLDTKEPLRVDLINESGRYVVKTDNPEYRPVCRFDNLPIQVAKDDNGNPCYKFALVDLDYVRKPDHKTVELLLRMFPKHQQLIVDTIQETNPALFEGYRHTVRVKDYDMMDPVQTISTRDEIINNYRSKKDIRFIKDTFWEDDSTNTCKYTINDD